MGKSTKGLWLFFAIFGLVIVLFPTLIINFFISKKYTYEVDATIIRITKTYDAVDDEYDYDVYISFTIDDTSYNTKMSSYSSDYREGKVIKVLVDPNNPGEGAIDPNLTKISTGIFTTIGGIFFIIGAVGLVSIASYNKKIEKVRRTGSTIVASYVETRMNVSYSYNGSHPYNVICKWTNPQDNKEYIFKSESLWKDPTHEIEGRHIDTFRVFVNPNNFNEYSVDIDNIKNSLM